MFLLILCLFCSEFIWPALWNNTRARFCHCIEMTWFFHINVLKLPAVRNFYTFLTAKPMFCKLGVVLFAPPGHDYTIRAMTTRLGDDYTNRVWLQFLVVTTGYGQYYNIRACIHSQSVTTLSGVNSGSGCDYMFRVWLQVLDATVGIFALGLQ